MKILSLILGLALTITGLSVSAQMNAEVLVESLDGKDIYVYHMPINPHEVLGVIKAQKASGTLSENMLDIKAQADQQYGNYDAIITRDGYSGTIIKYNGHQKNEARVVKTSYPIPVYALCKPTRGFQELAQADVPVHLQGAPFSIYCRNLIPIARSKEAEVGKIDAILIDRDGQAVFVRFL